MPLSSVRSPREKSPPIPGPRMDSETTLQGSSEKTYFPGHASHQDSSGQSQLPATLEKDHLPDYSPRPMRFEVSGERIPKTDPVWQHYVEVASHSDRASIHAWNNECDTLPIFAGLFAAVITAFIIEVYKDLKPDPDQVLLFSVQAGFMSLRTGNNSIPLSIPSNFQPTARAMRVNGCFFTALAFSLMSGAGAMLSKVWCAEYSRQPVIGSPHEQALRRQWYHNGLQIFRFQDVLDFLPVLLYCSIMMFMVGLCDWMYGISRKIALYLILIFCFSFVFAASLTFSALAMPEYFPYRVPLANLVIKWSKICYNVVKKKFLKTYGKIKKKYTTWHDFTLALAKALLKSPLFIGMFISSIATALTSGCHFLWNWLTGQLPERDAFVDAMSTKPVDDGYSSLEVEALAWLVKSSPSEDIVKGLLKSIPITVSTFKKRRKFFVEHGALGRLCTLFEYSFDRDWEGPYPGVKISSNPQKSLDMLEYGFAIYSLCTYDTFPYGLIHEIACLDHGGDLSHRILGMALRSCQQPSFRIPVHDILALAKEAIEQTYPISGQDLEMILGLVLRAITNRSLTSDTACETLCELMELRQVTSKTAALFCQALYHLQLDCELSEPMENYNPALCSYYLSYQCVSAMDMLSSEHVEHYGVILMKIIQCLCNNEAQVDLHEEVQRRYTLFVCSLVSSPSVTIQTLTEGMTTLTALSRKPYWGCQNTLEVICACYSVAIHSDCTPTIAKQALWTAQSVSYGLATKAICNSGALPAILFFIKEEIKQGIVSENYSQKTIHYWLSLLVEAEIENTFSYTLGPNDASLHKLFRYSNFQEKNLPMLPLCSALKDGGLTDISISSLLQYARLLEERQNSYRPMLSLVHVQYLFPQLTSITLFDDRIMTELTDIAANTQYSISIRRQVISIGVLIFKRLEENTLWSADEKKMWVKRCILDSGFVVAGESAYHTCLSSRIKDSVLWDAFHWLERLEARVMLNIDCNVTIALHQNGILEAIQGVLGTFQDEGEVMWMDHLEPNRRLLVSRQVLQKKIDQIKNVIFQPDS